MQYKVANKIQTASYIIMNWLTLRRNLYEKTIKKSIALGMAISMLGSVSAIAGTTASVAKILQ